MTTYCFPSINSGRRFGGAYEAICTGGTCSAPTYFLTDHASTSSAQRLSSVIAVLDASGNLLSEQRYMPFGQVRDDVDTITQTDFGYTSQRDLPDLGLMDYRARFYSPYLNHFTQPDTLIPSLYNPQSLNRYTYVSNRPTVFLDPTGHLPKDVCFDDGECGKPMTIKEKLWTYGVKLKNNWSNKDQISILLAVQATAAKMAETMGNSSDTDAFRTVFRTYSKPLVFSWDNNNPGCNIGKGGCTSSSRLISFFGDQWTTEEKLSTSDQLLYMTNNVVHELGHAFAARFPWNIGSTENPQINPNHPYNMVEDDLLSEVGWPEPYKAWRQHPSSLDDFEFSPGEVFADMFLGWVFSTYTTDLRGRSRKDFMNIHMPAWFIP